jgi:hypothetical protein
MVRYHACPGGLLLADTSKYIDIKPKLFTDDLRVQVLILLLIPLTVDRDALHEFVHY